MKITGIFFLSLFLMNTSNIYAQKDSVIIENSTEPIKQSDFKQKRKYQYLDNNFRKEKTLIKLGVSPINFNTEQEDTYGRYNFIFCFEKKLTPSLSIINFEGYKKLEGYNRTEYLYSDLGLRYYYAMNKRIKDSIGVNNFHGNYFSIKIEEWFKYTTEWSFYNYQESERFSFNPYINLSWGIQRRLGKLGFADAGPYIKFNRTKLEFGINLFIGLGLGFKN